MPRVLVTGATGFLGLHLTRRLVADGHEVSAMVRPATTSARLDRLPREARRVEADLRDDGALRRALDATAPEWIFHAAGRVMRGGRPAPTREIAEVNLLGTIRLLDLLQDGGVTACVLVGDAFEYGPSPGPVSEGAPCNPTTPDGVAKLGATLYAQRLARASGFPVVVIRLFSVYGADDDARRLVPQVVEGALGDGPILLSRADIARDFVFVDDAVDLLLRAGHRAADLAGAIFNGGTGRAVTIGEVVDTVMRIAGSSSEVRWGAWPVADHDASMAIADPAAARETLGWSARTTLADGLGAVVADALRREGRGRGNAVRAE